jgi:hypothetical protein
MKEILTSPAFLMAIFTAVMMIYMYHRGRRRGREECYNDLMKALGVPKGAIITGVTYRVIEAQKRI